MGPSKVSLVCLAVGNRIEMERLKASVFAGVGSDQWAADVVGVGAEIDLVIGIWLECCDRG